MDSVETFAGTANPGAKPARTILAADEDPHALHLQGDAWAHGPRLRLLHLHHPDEEPLRLRRHDHQTVAAGVDRGPAALSLPAAHHRPDRTHVTAVRHPD